MLGYVIATGWTGNGLMFLTHMIFYFVVGNVLVSVNSEIQQFICLHNSISDGLNAFTLLHCLGSEKFVRI
jgi:hypothetical protein